MSAIVDWARVENLQPEPIMVEIWQTLPEEFRRLVEVTNGNAVRAETSTRLHQEAVSRIADLIRSAAVAPINQHNCDPLDVYIDIDVVLWEIPRATIRRPSVILLSRAPHEVRPLSAHQVKLVVEVATGATSTIYTVTKKSEYALAGIPWYWIVWIADNQVSSIQIHVLDHALGQYRLHALLKPSEVETFVEMPIRIEVDWGQLTGLTR
ncbi:Uma2 family endonuclease [Nocardia sp. NPDC046473]|uniref:Uma2 family endonuclease n=1 Tax=Nocardia sp. NPDC046473 TaxID=3155733 RepID=UPI0033DA8843